MDKISLTMEESRLWFEWELQSSVLYNLNIQYRLSGLVDIERLNLALSTTANLFDAFRTYFTEEDGVPYKVISLVNDFRIDVLDLTQSALSDSSQREKFANQRRIALLNQSFDLTKPSLFRCNLIKFSPKNYYFIFVMPHILCDAYSLNLFLNLLSRIYNGGEEEKLKIESEYQLRLTEQLSDTWAEVTPSELEVESYWKSKFENALCQIEFKIFKKGSSKYSGKRIWLPLPTDLISGLKKLATAEHTTLFNILAASISIFLYRYFEQEDICLYYPVNTRPKNKYSNQLFGFYVNELGLRTKLSKKLTFREVLAHIVQQRLMDKKYQSYPLIEALLAKLRMDNPTLEFPFNVGLVKTSFFKWREDALKDISIQPFDSFDYDGVINDLLFLYEEITEDNKYQLAFAVDYNTSIFDTVFMQRMVSHLTTLLENIIANPDERINKLSLLTEKERHQLLIEWNQTEAYYPVDKTISELFEEQVEKNPDAIALVFEGEELTYRELNAQANQLGHYLRSLGVGPEDLIAICLKRSFEMVIGILGILKAGGAYVPLDPEYPEEHLRFMLEDTQAKVLVTHSSVANKFVAYEGQVISWDQEKLQIAQQSKANLSNLISPKNLAYVIYTSGSTGRPKGILVSHYNFVGKYFNEIKNRYPGESTLICINYVFDPFIRLIFIPLLSGGKVILLASSLSVDISSLVSIIKIQKIDFLCLVPSILQILLNYISNFCIIIPEKVGCLYSVGERLEVNILEKALIILALRVSNQYGPSETTGYSTEFTYKEYNNTLKNISIGKPISNTRIYILNNHLHLSLLGAVGELYIGGAGLARGYLNRAELTKERFIENPFSSEEDKRLGRNLRLYRTGDLVRYLADGNIEYIGRIDHQVKLRGYRIELGEIEVVLRQETDVKEAVVIAREDKPGQKRLVAYLVLGEKLLEVSEAGYVRGLRGRLEQKLPEYMVPSAFMVLERIPLTATGKLDRQGLPVPDKQYCIEEYVAPRTEIEKELALIWSELLGVSKISIHDNFFKLGGHSLLAIQLNSRIRKRYEIELPLRCLFECPVLKSLAETITNEQAQVTVPLLPSLQLMQREEVLPLSFAQQRLWFLEQFNTNRSAYNIPFALRLIGKLDIAALREAFNQLIVRHEILRTVFQECEGKAQQIILSKLNFDLKEVDLISVPVEKQELQIKELIRREANKAFDLSQGPLIRGQLLRIGLEAHILLLTMHHIVSDGWSIEVFNRELSIFYNAYKNKQSVLLESLPIQYADFTLWQRRCLSGEVLEQQLAYWKQQLADMPGTLSLPVDKARPAVSSYRGASYLFNLSAELTKQLRVLSEEMSTTLFMILLAVFQVLLYRYSGQEDVTVGTPIANRNHREIEELIGFFVNTLVLRASCQGNLSFTQFLEQVRETTLDAYSHQDVPFEQLVEHLDVERSLNYHPLFQVMFVFQNIGQGTLEFQELSSEVIEIENEVAKFDLTLTVREEIEGLNFSFEYASDLFEIGTVERMGMHLVQLLEGIVANPTEQIDQLVLLTEKERHQLLIEWNQTEAWYPHDKTIHELFEAQVEQSPDAVALIFEGEQLTYRELNEKANQLGHYLRSLGVGPEDLIAICLKRSFEMVIGILGILKAGGAYVPLDPEYPEERLRFMLEDTQAKVLVTHSSVANKFVAYEGQVISWDHEKLQIAQQSKANLSNLISPKNLAYVIYTSGSTGKPKGVMVEQRAVVNMVYVHIKEFAIKPEDIILQFARFIFDASLPELLGTLLAGARVCLIPQTVKLIGDNLLDVLKRESITIVTVTPSALETIPFNTALPALRLLVVAGEASAEVTIKKWSQHYQMMNVYGPTETTVCASFEKIDLNKRKLSIGKPIANTKVYVLDQSRNPVPIGVAGELYIGGVGLARGYLNREELTKERFIENPFASEEDKRLGKNLRLYQSSDLVRYLADGNIEYIGRIDHQVKLRGYRIELGEIETLLRQQSEIKEAAVIAREDILGQKRLVAYVVLQDKLLGEVEEATWVNDLHQRVEQQLPEYMLPSAIMLLEQLPLTPNGKLDRRALPIPDKQYRTESYVAPRTEIEKQLASIWSELLNVSPISIHDNFFRVGGHSLLAVRLVRLIEKKLAKTISLANVFKYPTIKDLATFLYDKYEALPNDLLPIQPKGKLPALFLVHPAAGLATPYFSLLLDNREQPIYGINNPTLNGDKECFTSIEEMAITYVDIVQAVQKTGPYRLGGWSFGGNVALEMARQFQFRGETVEIVILMDSDTDFKESRVKEDKFLEKIVLDIKQSAREKEIIRKEFDNATKMLRKYKIKPYEQRVILLKATKNKKNQLCNGWEVFLPQLEVYSVCGQHFDLLYGESAQEISVKLNEILSKPKPAIFELQKLSLFERIALGAAARNDAFLVKLSLEKIEDFNINVQDHLERTLLHWAVSYGNSELFDFLLRYDPQVNISDKKGNTPIMLAENKDYTEIGYRELNIAQQLEKMGYAHYKTEIEAKLKSQKERINIYNKLKEYGTEIV